MQSVRLDVPDVVHWLKKCFAVMQPEEQIWPFSSATLRRRLQQILQCAFLPLSDLEDDLPRLQWRGRWLHSKTLAHYTQEVGCINVLESVTQAFRLKVQCLAGLAEAACNGCRPR